MLVLKFVVIPMLVSVIVILITSLIIWNRNNKDKFRNSTIMMVIAGLLGATIYLFIVSTSM